jgi:hypothetical protein
MLSAAQPALGAGATPDPAFDFDALRAREFARLDAHGHAYLDYAATALYGASQLRAHHAVLADGVFGNPHSESAMWSESTLLASTELGAYNARQVFAVTPSLPVYRASYGPYGASGYIFAHNLGTICPDPC